MAKGEIRALTDEGDLKVIWDTQSDTETEAAKDQFDRLIKKGYRAFSVDKKGEKGKEIKKFDSDSGMIIMTPGLVGG